MHKRIDVSFRIIPYNVKFDLATTNTQSNIQTNQMEMIRQVSDEYRFLQINT